jgi:hypothetical protein
MVLLGHQRLRRQYALLSIRDPQCGGQRRWPEQRHQQRSFLDLKRSRGERGRKVQGGSSRADRGHDDSDNGGSDSEHYCIRNDLFTATDNDNNNISSVDSDNFVGSSI